MPAVDVAACWRLAEAISPRRGLRTDTWDDTTSTWLHQYDHQPWPDAPPPGPYALYLADESGQFRLLCFDLDTTRGDVETDLARLRDLLDTAGVRYVVTASGTGGGRHVWLATGPGGAAPLAVRRLAKLLARALPTLDHGMLCNPGTGAARPPGAPHRDGGHAVLLDPATPLAAAAALESGVSGVVERLTEELDATVSTPDERSTATLTTREIIQRNGGLALAGLRREPSPSTRAALDTVARDGEASGLLATVLVGLALARWSWPEVHALLDRAPGLEHARTRSNPRAGAARIRRGSEEAVALLRRQWRRCVEYAAQLPPAATQDAINRAEETARYVATVQAALDEDPARWARQSGPADRGVLDAVCLVALEACGVEIDLDVRRAAAMAGISKSAAARAFDRLSKDGFLLRTAEAVGPRAATWKLLPPATTPEQQQQGGTQGPRPPGPVREDLRHRLRESLRIRAADAFAPRKVGGLGRHCARVAAACVNGANATTLSRICGYTVETCERYLTTMRKFGLVRQTRSGSATLNTSALARAARRLGTHGYRGEQARWMLVDREVYAWWREEEQWMRARKRPRRPHSGEQHLQLWGARRREPFPRSGERADFAEARRRIAGRHRLVSA
ncbi:hypothetical protein BS329_15630 [Amycolatopsis coloradensis]|uniref:Uncharacterized protein n=1 Tax=Amycolatopsis coloradensis TaxID=76021 RepID=A0A1R0KUA5_9PSEU|nr:hypothetical protein [Amycolatopsis coloradensis]OLZ51694.1 hypothetical protein BS329_15630 [Amycolatopsis coloradensis]